MKNNEKKKNEDNSDLRGRVAVKHEDDSTCEEETKYMQFCKRLFLERRRKERKKEN